MITSGYENKRARVEMLPLIDVVFLLLVFFIYAMVSMVVHHGVAVKLPTATTASVDHHEYVSITITEDNVIFINEEQIELSQLTEKVTTLVHAKNNAPVFINGDQGADLGVAIKILDLLRKSGIQSVSFECEQ